MKTIVIIFSILTLTTVSHASPSYELSSATLTLNMSLCSNIALYMKITKKIGSVSEKDKIFFDKTSQYEGPFAKITFSSAVSIPKTVVMSFLGESLPVAELTPVVALEETENTYTVAEGRPVRIRFNLLGICQHYTTDAQLDYAAKKTVDSLIIPHVSEVN